MAEIESRLAEAGLILPDKLRLPEGMVLPFPEVHVVGDRAMISGASALEPDGTVSGPFGQVGAEVTLDQAHLLARKTALTMISSLKRRLGDLDRVAQWVKVLGMVNSAPGFGDQPAVINGFSHLILDLWGPERGAHARSAVGMAGLPMRIAVEVEAEVLIRP